MDKLLKKYNDYMRLENCKAEYKLSNGQSVAVWYREENFAHLKKIFLDILHKQRNRYILFTCLRYNRDITYK